MSHAGKSAVSSSISLSLRHLQQRVLGLIIYRPHSASRIMSCRCENVTVQKLQILGFRRLGVGVQITPVGLAIGARFVTGVLSLLAQDVGLIIVTESAVGAAIWTRSQKKMRRSPTQE